LSPRHEEGVGDLGGGQAAHGAQRQRDGRWRSQRRVAAHEEQHERVVLLAPAPLTERRREQLLGRLLSRH
jgi:hypothetical protein